MNPKVNLFGVSSDSTNDGPSVENGPFDGDPRQGWFRNDQERRDHDREFRRLTRQVFWRTLWRRLWREGIRGREG